MLAKAAVARLIRGGETGDFVDPDAFRPAAATGHGLLLVQKFCTWCKSFAPNLHQESYRGRPVMTQEIA
jgi:hypothetical protein